MKTRLWTIIVGATLSMVLPDTLTADVIYSNFGPGDTFNTTYSWGIGAFYSGTNPNVGASFKVGPADMLFDSAQVAFLGSISGTNSLTLGIYSNSSDNLPGTLLQSFTLTNIPHAPNAPTVVTFSATGPLRLSANTTYWLASDEHDTDLFGWHWNSTSQLGVAFRLGFDPWFVSSTDLTPAFRINGTPISVTSTTGVIYAATTNGVFKSTNGGASWSPLVPVASAFSRVTRKTADITFGYGDYEGLAVAGGVAHPMWTDARAANRTGSEIFTASLTR